MENKKAWIKIVEAFTAVLLVVIVLLIIINSGYIKKKDISSQIYDVQISILREIQFNDTLRTEILSVEFGESLFLEWEDPAFPLNLKNKIIERTPNYLECNAKICSPEDLCGFTETLDENIYAESVLIAASLEYGDSPKQLKLFCWTK